MKRKKKLPVGVGIFKKLIQYDEYLRNEGHDDIWAYRIAFYEGRCKVVVEKLNRSCVLNG